MRYILPIVAALMAAPAATRAEDIPLPPPRPAMIDTMGSATQTAPSIVLESTERSDCQTRLEDRAVFRPLSALVGPGECGAIDVVRLEAILMPNRERVTLTPPATLRCTMAEAITDWVREDVGAAAGDVGGSLIAVENYDSYECRGRNRVRGAKLSEHGKANALDIRALKLSTGKSLVLTDAAVSQQFRERMRQSACARFKTVLGPGSDGYHETHIHVDLAQRNHGYAMCQWDIRSPGQSEVAEIPLPRPRPAELGAKERVSGRRLSGDHRL
jgi:hypothetical protein